MTRQPSHGNRLHLTTRRTEAPDPGEALGRPGDHPIREHVCIRRPEYVAGTAARPEVGVFTQTSVGRKPVPWGRIADGETVWMKWTAGPIVAKATVSGFRQLSNATPIELRQAIVGFALHDLDEYWSALAPNIHALVIYLRDQSWLNEALPVTGRSYGSSWVVFEKAGDRAKWMATPARASSANPRDPRGLRAASPSLRFAVFRRDSYTCQYCGRKAPAVPLHIDHVIPWSRGGHTVLSNLKTACNVCNLGKGGLSP